MATADREIFGRHLLSRVPDGQRRTLELQIEGLQGHRLLLLAHRPDHAPRSAWRRLRLDPVPFTEGELP